MSNIERSDIERMLSDDNMRLRMAGCRLAEAALLVIRTYDGTHRLSLAVADWCTAVASEGGRSKINEKLAAVKAEDFQNNDTT